MDINQKINLEEFASIIASIIDRIKEAKGNQIKLENDFFWNIQSDELYNPYTNPTNFTLGQLSDDLSELKRLVANNDDAIPYDLRRIANILRALSEEISYI